MVKSLRSSQPMFDKSCLASHFEELLAQDEELFREMSVFLDYDENLTRANRMVKIRCATCL